MSDLATFLSTVPLFEGAPQRALEIAAGVVQSRKLDDGSVIFQEGDVGEALYILREGLVKLSKVDLEGHEKTLTILRPPEFFGEMALFGEANRSATAVTLGKTQVMVLYGDDFERLMSTYPQISWNVTATLAKRLRGMDDEAQILSYKDAQGRVAYVLLRLYRNGLIEFNDQGKGLIRLTHQELASLAGTSRETVTRALKALEGEQVIQTKPKEVLLVDPDGLEEILHGIRD